MQTQAAPTACVFTVGDVAWIEAAGTAQTPGRYFDIDLPPETATRVLRQEQLPYASEIGAGRVA
jgi:hypothetical protein